ncbi:MAG: diguanylate cyclase [Clostridia bacterium]|nr:diguanylate cyclase [Clostridia bacterium]
MKKIIVFILLALLASHLTFANEISTEEVIETIRDSNTSNEEITYLIQTIENSEEQKSLAQFLKGFLMLRNQDYNQGYLSLQEAYNTVQGKNDFELEAEILYHLMYIAFEYGDITNALNYSQALKELSEAQSYSDYIIEADFILSYTFLLYYDTDPALTLAEELLVLSKENHNQKGEYLYHIILGVMYKFEQDYDKALNHFLDAKNLYDEHWYSVIGNESFTMNLALISTQLNRDNTYEANLLLTESKKNLLNLNPYDQFNYYSYLGDYYMQLQPPNENEARIAYEASLIALSKAKIIDKAYPYEYDTYLSLAQIYNHLGQYDKAVKYYEKAIHISFPDSNKDIEQNFATLETYKMKSINEQMTLLESLNRLNAEKFQLARRFIIGMIVSIVVLVLLSIFAIKAYLNKRKAEALLYKHSITDALTQTYNRSKIMELFEKNIDQHCGVILLDLDNFKNINDTYGHVFGDHVLKTVSSTIKNSIRTDDILGRYGGEEFLILLPNATIQEMMLVGERVRKNIETLVWEYDSLKTTASIGITDCFSSNTDEVLHKADTLMYQAKHKGKNQVVCY